MNNKVIVSCAVTGSGDTAKKHPDLPKTPEQIAKAAIEAAKAGAAIAHIHVRESDGKPSRKIEYLILNLKPYTLPTFIRTSVPQVLTRHI